MLASWTWSYRDLRTRLADLLAHSASWFNLPLLDESGQDLNALQRRRAPGFGIHAGWPGREFDDAGAAPETVRMELAQDFARLAAARRPIPHPGQRSQRQAGLADAGLSHAGRRRAMLWLPMRRPARIRRGRGRSLALLLQELSELCRRRWSIAPICGGWNLTQ